MDKAQFDELQGIDVVNTSIAAPQVSFRELLNYYVNRDGEHGALVKRGGSNTYSVTGDLWGIKGYKLDTGTAAQPPRDVPIRHRRNASTSYIEKLTLSTDAWANITLGAQTSFSIGDIMQTAQIKDLMCICAGKPAQLSDITSGSVERLGGEAPSAPSVATGAAGVLTGTYSYVITFKDETSGWESSPSAVTSNVSPSAQQVAMTSIPTTAQRENVSHVYIYRTISTNEAPYRYAGKVTLGTATYNDNIADASLGEAAPVAEDHDPPPTEAYVVAAFKQRFWIAAGNEIYYSQPDDGTGVPLEYFSPNRVVRVDNKVTALMPNAQGGLYIFSAPGFGIKEILGRFTDENDFEVVDAFPGEGTYFGSSVAIGGKNNELIAYWGGSGPTFIANKNINTQSAEQVSKKYEDAVIGEYDGNIFAWTVWDALRGHFIMSICSLGSTIGQWVNSVSGSDSDWEDSVAVTDVEWGG